MVHSFEDVHMAAGEFYLFDRICTIRERIKPWANWNSLNNDTASTCFKSMLICIFADNVNLLL